MPPVAELPGARFRRSGFTLIELMVVMAAIGLLLALTAPRYIEHVDRTRETVLRHNLAGMREAIEKFRADRGRDPATLQELIEQRYLREVPLDPVTERRDTWVLVSRPGAGSGVADVRSGAEGKGRDGEAYAAW
jgi:general secretion pathway protein G